MRDKAAYKGSLSFSRLDSFKPSTHFFASSASAVDQRDCNRADRGSRTLGVGQEVIHSLAHVDLERTVSLLLGDARGVGREPYAAGLGQRDLVDGLTVVCAFVIVQPIGVQFEISTFPTLQGVRCAELLARKITACLRQTLVSAFEQVSFQCFTLRVLKVMPAVVWHAGDTHFGHHLAVIL